MSLRGKTGDFPLDVVLRLLGDTKKTGELTLRGSAGQGALGLAEGHLVSAVFGDEAAVPALSSLFDMGDADFEFTPSSQAPAANLEGDLDTLHRHADDHRRWLASVREVIPSDRTRFRLSERAADQGAVTFTAERWRVVLAANGERDVNDLAAHLGVDRNAALDSLAGLVRDGVLETVAAPAGEPARAPRAAAVEAPTQRAGWAAPTPPEAAAPAPAPEPTAAPEWTKPQPRTDRWTDQGTAQQTAGKAAEGTPPAPEPGAPASMDDRLAALFGSAPTAPTTSTAPPPSAPPADGWSPPSERWTPTAPERWEPETAAPAALPSEPETHAPPASEWGPPPPETLPRTIETPQRKGLFGLFRREEHATGPGIVEHGASTRAGLLAAFSNALLSEYNSGQYGRSRVDDRIPSLLMRVDEQADPIDHPLPVVDDRLDVQALERGQLSEAQSAPYLATLVATIYDDAERAFGRDKAKRGYRAAQQSVFGEDVSTLAAPDVAGKLPKV